MLIPAVACADKTSDNEPAATVATETEETTAQDLYDPHLPDLSFDDSTFTILTKGVSAYNEWGETSIYTEAQNGDAVNDAIFIRNSYIEETYKVKLAEYPSTNPSGDIKNSVAAADAAYDVVMPAFGDCGTLASGGNFMNLYELEYNDFTRPWWDQRSISDLTVDSKLFFCRQRHFDPQ